MTILSRTQAAREIDSSDIGALDIVARHIKLAAGQLPGTTGKAPIIWALFSNRAGDNAQVQALVDALALPYLAKSFANRPLAIPMNLALGSRYPWSVKEVAPDISTPWPDVVIAAGTQSEPLCRLIADRAAADGHRVRMVFLGRPWRRPDAYDLIVTTPQYKVPHGPNVLELALPLHLVTREAAQQAADRWRDRISHLPKPHIMVALGGSINRYTLDGYAARRLAHRLNELAGAVGGSLLICSSYRTPAGITETLARHLEVPFHLYDWRAGGAENPYLAFLGLADLSIVTGDSMTMLAEACEMRKPVFIFDLGEGRLGMKPGGGVAAGSRDRLWISSTLRAWRKHLKVGLIERVLPRRLIRNTDPIRDFLVASGQAAWLGDRLLARTAEAGPAPAEIVAARLRALIAHLPAGAARPLPQPRLIPLPAGGTRHAS